MKRRRRVGVYSGVQRYEITPVELQIRATQRDANMKLLRARSRETLPVAGQTTARSRETRADFGENGADPGYALAVPRIDVEDFGYDVLDRGEKLGDTVLALGVSR